MSAKDICLILHTAEQGIQLVLGDLSQPKVLHSFSSATPGQGAELLIPALQSLCKLGKIQVQEIQKIACIRGPGSFTGLRLCLSTASGLRRGNGACLAGIELLPLLAYSVQKILPINLLGEFQGTYVLSHARKNLVYRQSFFLQNAQNFAQMQASTPLEAIPPTQALEELRQKAERYLILGSGLSNARELFLPLTSKHLLLPSSFDQVSAKILLEVAQSLHYSPKDLEPLYVRGCDAEENLAHIAEKLHHNPTESQKKLAQLLKERRFE